MTCNRFLTPFTNSKTNTMTTINKIKIAEAFMESMKDYMARQDDWTFDANEELYNLYTDLSTIYYNAINE